MAEPFINEKEVSGYQPVNGHEGKMRRDNYAASLAEELRKKGLFYYWTWIPVKVGYDKYDEGMAIFSKNPIHSSCVFNLSNTNDYHNWKTRKALGIHTEKGWFFTVHMGWWKDEEEPFKAQWESFSENIRKLTDKKETSLWVMGDFNSPASVRGEGYDLVSGSGWKDTWKLAKKKEEGFTAPPKIDGWKEADKTSPKQGMRIDYIWHWGDINIEESRILCNGKREPVVSDHYAVMIETGK